MDLRAIAPYPILLMGMITLVALRDRRRARDGGLLMWWRPIARAFAGAGLFLILALIHLWARGIIGTAGIG